MQNIIIFTAILAYVSAAPVVFLTQTYPVKSTLTKGHQIIDHGSTYHATVLHAAPLNSKTTITKSSQLVDHGSTHVVHAVPVVHQHEPVHVQVHEPIYGSTYHSNVHYVAPLNSKTTVTKSSQHVNHGSTHLVHAAPVVHQHEPVHVQIHEPVHVHEPVHLHHAKSSQFFHLETSHAPKVAVHLHEPLVHVHEAVHVPVHTHRIGDSAVSQQSSTVHETVPYVKYGLH